MPLVVRVVVEAEDVDRPGLDLEQVGAAVRENVGDERALAFDLNDRFAAFDRQHTFDVAAS